MQEQEQEQEQAEEEQVEAKARVFDKRYFGMNTVPKSKPSKKRKKSTKGDKERKKKKSRRERLADEVQGILDRTTAADKRAEKQSQGFGLYRAVFQWPTETTANATRKQGHYDTVYSNR